MSVESTTIPFTTKLTAAQKLELANLFQKYDKDHSGALDKKEFRSYFVEATRLTLGVTRNHQYVFEIIDADHSKTVSFDEFIAFQDAMLEIQESMDIKKYYKMIYDSCDRGSKGYLTPKEFKKFLKYMGMKVGVFEAKKQVKTFDIDGDGKIEWSEITETLDRQAREAAEQLEKQLARLREKTKRFSELMEEGDY